MTERITIIGLGYVGLPIALSAVEAGYDVVGVEVDSGRLSSGAVTSKTSPTAF